jgi:hypothetical protein
MIIYSDNVSAVLVSKILGEEKVTTIYRDLGLPIPDLDPSVSYRITTKDYASFFRILYNSSYLNRESSEAVLSLLATIDLTEGIKMRVPGGVVIAHKFCERRDIVLGNFELHDCGIIYHPK